jgi:hypothetical protein
MTFLAAVLGAWFMIAFYAGWGCSRLYYRAEVPPLPKQPESVCGCRHHLAFHEPGTGTWKEVMTDRFVMKDGKLTSEFAPCRCRKYTGPEPLAGYFTQEISS